MFYNYVELNDGTQIAYSNFLEDGTVQIGIERPTEDGFDSARCLLPAFFGVRLTASARTRSINCSASFATTCL